MRLNKYLQTAGICSRRAADRLIEQGAVSVDGKKATLGMNIEDTQMVCVNGKKVTKESHKVLLCFHKPRGIVCTAEKREPNNVIDYIGYPTRIFPVGRLDKDSTGLLLLTNDGDLANELMRARNGHEREYIVETDVPVKADFIRRMENGVYLSELDVRTRPCKVRKINRQSFSIILTQGLNRQIRRMCKECGANVVNLKRIRIGNIKLTDLAEGVYREATSEEREGLYRLVRLP